jgi:hypothetical protein
MKDIVLTVPGDTKEQKLSWVEKEVEDFSRYMSTIGDWKAVGPLNEMEKTLLRTYFVAKLKGALNG